MINTRLNKSEEEIYNEIIKRVEGYKNRNEYLVNMIYKGNKQKAMNSILYKKEYIYLDYLDGRKNLITIDNFCRYTGEKISKNKIKKELSNYFNKGIDL